jgi:23S rRNA pseudouridine2457 synthase
MIPSPGARTILFYKPFGVLSQFSVGLHPGRHQTLAAFGPFPKDVYPVGRLDADSEGLLLLTNDNALKHRLLDPQFRHPRTYLAQVERTPSPESISALTNGSLFLDGKAVLPAEVLVLQEEPSLPQRSHPIRFRKNVPTAWLEITLHEGRNRQVRKMAALVGHPVLRLVRVRVGPLTLEGLSPGKKKALSVEENASFYKHIFGRVQPPDST